MPNNFAPASGFENDEEEGLGIDLKKLVARFIDHWKIFALSIIFALAITYIYLKRATPIYKINATLMIQDPEKGGNLFGSTTNALSDLGDLFGTKSSVDNEAQVLQTEDLTLNVAKELKLYEAVYQVERFKTVELYKESPFNVTIIEPLDSIHNTILKITPIDNSAGHTLRINEDGQDGDSSYLVTYNTPFKSISGVSMMIGESGMHIIKNMKYEIDVIPVVKAAAALQKSLKIDIPSKEVTTINLQLLNSDRAKGVFVLDNLINQYIHRNIDQKNAFADSTIEFIKNRITIVNDELTGIEKRVQTFQENNKIADIKEQASQVINNENQNQKDLSQAQVQKQIVQSALSYLQNENNNHRPVPSLLASPDPTFLVLLEKYNTSQIQADKLSLGSTQENPMVVNLNTQIDNLRKDLITNLKSQLSAIELGLDKLQSENNEVNSFIQSVPEKERQYIGLAREQDIKQALFIYLLQKKEEVAVTKASNISSCVVIDSPKAEELPSSPRKGVILVIALFCAFAIPYLFLLLKDALNNKISGPQDLAQCDAVSLGEIGHNLQGKGLVFQDKSRSLIAEQFRILRTNLQFALGQSNCPVILITSSMSGEGKSFISTNLALAYTFNDKKVLLMELDLRKPKIATQLSVKAGMGFSNFIIAKPPLKKSEIINSTEASSSLDLLTAGPIPPNPSELLSNPKTKELIDDLKLQYDYIIIDTAPIGLVTDAQLLAPYADLTLYIVRQDYTFKHQINIINNLIQSGKIPKIYTIMNDTKLKTSSRYGYDNAGGYNYGYGYINEEKLVWWKRLLLFKN